MLALLSAHHCTGLSLRCLPVCRLTHSTLCVLCTNRRAGAEPGGAAARLVGRSHPPAAARRGSCAVVRAPGRAGWSDACRRSGLCCSRLVHLHCRQRLTRAMHVPHNTAPSHAPNQRCRPPATPPPTPRARPTHTLQGRHAGPVRGGERAARAPGRRAAPHAARFCRIPALRQPGERHALVWGG